MNLRYYGYQLPIIRRFYLSPKLQLQIPRSCPISIVMVHPHLCCRNIRQLKIDEGCGCRIRISHNPLGIDWWNHLHCRCHYLIPVSVNRYFSISPNALSSDGDLTGIVKIWCSTAMILRKELLRSCCIRAGITGPAPGLLLCRACQSHSSQKICSYITIRDLSCPGNPVNLEGQRFSCIIIHCIPGFLNGKLH